MSVYSLATDDGVELSSLSVQGIRHQCKEMFQNIVRIHQHLSPSTLSLWFPLSPVMLVLVIAIPCAAGDDSLLSLAQRLLSLDSHTRGKFILLSSLVQYLAVGKLLALSPSLPQDLLSVMGHQALACHVRESFHIM